MVSNWILRGVLIPLVILVCSLGLFLVAGMRGSLGPLNLGAVNWITGIQWVFAPVVGGLVAADLGKRALRSAAAVLAAVVGTFVALFLVNGAGTGTATCAVDFGRSAIPFILGCAAIGGITGGGMGASLLFTASGVRRGQTWLGVAIGAVLNLVAAFGAYLLFYSVVRCLS